MRPSAWLLALLITPAYAQSPAWLDRLPADILDVQAPSMRVIGMPGSLTIAQSACRTLPVEDVRRRIVNTAVQEWGYFGFSVVDQTVEDDDNGVRRTGAGRRTPGPRPLTADLNQRPDEEVLQLAMSVGGYWSATPDGNWMLERQNETWQGPLGYRSDWRDLWSAAFISWVMCESGLGEKERGSACILIVLENVVDYCLACRFDGYCGSFDCLGVFSGVWRKPTEPRQVTGQRINVKYERG